MPKIRAPQGRASPSAERSAGSVNRRAPPGCRFAHRATERLLLLRQRQREFAVADAHREAFGEFRHRILAIGGDELGECGEQARLRQAIAVDTVMARFGPRLVQIGERRLLLLVIGKGLAGEMEGHVTALETGGTELTRSVTGQARRTLV